MGVGGEDLSAVFSRSVLKTYTFTDLGHVEDGAARPALQWQSLQDCLITLQVQSHLHLLLLAEESAWLKDDSVLQKQFLVGLNLEGHASVSRVDVEVLAEHLNPDCPVRFQYLVVHETVLDLPLSGQGWSWINSRDATFAVYIVA